MKYPGIAAVAGVEPEAPLLLNDSIIQGFATAAANLDLSTTGLTWAAGDYVLSVFGHTTVTLSSVAGTSTDTYASILAEIGAIAKLYAHEGTIGGSGLDATVRYAQSVSRRGVASLLAFRGVAANTSQPNVFGNASGTSASPISPAITTTVDGCTIISAFHTFGRQPLAGVNGAVPSGYTLIESGRTQATDSITATSDSTLALAYRTKSVAGVVPAATWLNAMGESHEWNALHLAVAPA